MLNNGLRKDCVGETGLISYPASFENHRLFTVKTRAFCCEEGKNTKIMPFSAEFYNISRYYV